MRAFVNSGDESRTWPGIQRPDGSTLRLDPGETAELDLPGEFEDEYLKPVKTSPAAAKHKAARASSDASDDQGAE